MEEEQKHEDPNPSEIKPEDPEYKDELTVKVKRRKNVTNCIKTIESLSEYFRIETAENAENDEKTGKIQIYELDSSVISSKFIEIPKFPSELKDFKLIIYGSYMKNPLEINDILENIVKKSPNLEAFKLCLFDVNCDISVINFEILQNFKKLKVFKLNLGLNSLNKNTIISIIKAFKGHNDLVAISLSLNNCELTDDFLKEFSEELLIKEQLHKKLMKIKLDFSQNLFKFDFFQQFHQKIDFLECKNLENINIKLSFNENCDKLLFFFNKKLKEILNNLMSLKALKLNFFYCPLKHENIENLCEVLCKFNEKIDLKLDMRQDMKNEIEIKTIKAIEGMISLYRAVVNPKRFNVYY